MFLIVFFLVMTAIVGSQIKRERTAHGAILAISFVTEALFYSFRFA